MITQGEHASMLPNRNFIFTLFSFFILFVSSQATIAASLYISDTLYVPVRKGQGNQFSILHKGLPSGTKVTLVERETEWTKVTTAGGVTGWVRNQFLDRNPPAKLQLSSANIKIASLSDQLVALREEKNTLETNYRTTQEELKETESVAQKTTAELGSLKAISSSAVESHQRLQTLAQKMQLLQTENDVLKSENESLRRSESTTFFIYGVFAVLLGVILASVLPKLKPSKRNTGWLN
ncbi:MAG: SH3 domain protein [Cellvibrionaceae bacterium]|jgi:SH3 domain protein